MSADSTVVPSTRGDTGEAFLDGAVEAIRDKGLRYAGVSVFNLILGSGLLAIFFRLLSASDEALAESDRFVRGATANTFAVAISAVPAYYLSRAYVWGKRGPSELRREILPFWTFAVVGMLLSTVGVGLVAHFIAAPRSAGFFHPAKLAANAAYIFAFAILWVLRFFWMDRAFHLDHHHAHGPLDVMLDEDDSTDEG